MEARRMLVAEIEPNDTVATATQIQAGDLAEGTLADAADVDHFAVDLEQGEAFRMNTFNVNAPLFDVPLPPGLRLFDPDGNVVAVSDDSRDLAFVAPTDGTYTIEIVAANAFGTFVGEYGMATYSVGEATAAELEPNGPNDPPRAANLGAMTTGTLDSATDVDRFTVIAEPGQFISVAFAGLPEQAPAVRVLQSTGTVVAEDFTGAGLVAPIQTLGTHIVELSGANVAAGVIDDYVTIINVHEGDVETGDRGSGIETAFDWQLDSRDGVPLLTSSIGGVLDGVGDADWFRFEIDSLSNVDLRVQNSGLDQIAPVGKTLTLYNRYGQIVMRSNKPSRQTTFGVTIETEVSTDIPDALIPGVYYAQLTADSPVGVGAYVIEASLDQTFSRQRDQATHFMDFDSDRPYLGFERTAAYAVPEAVPFYVGRFDSRYSPFQVDVTLDPVTEGNEFVGQGIGNFGDVGAGGFGGGNRGDRSTQGSAVSSATETSVGSLSALRTNTVNHEFGHAAGLPHTRDVQAFMSYVGRNEYLPVGKTYGFPWTDSRVPGSVAENHRNYLDWSLFGGAQIVHQELGSDESPTELDRFFPEMSLDHRVDQTIAVSNEVMQVQSGDFDGDGRDDIVAISTGGDVQLFITNDDGTLGAPAVRNVGNVRWWHQPMSTGDVNADNRTDVIVGNFDDSEVLVLLGNADGTLAAPITIAAAGGVIATATGDLDGNGFLDVAVSIAGGRVQTFLGDGAGGFTAGVTVTAPGDLESIAVGDINGDRRDDVVVGNASGQDVSIFLSTGATLTAMPSIQSLGDRVRSVAVADFTGEGAADLAVISEDPRAVEILTSAGDGSFVRSQVDYVTNRGGSAQIADANGDGRPDLFIGGRGVTASVMLGLEDGSLTRPITIVGTDTQFDATAADLDQDGTPEIITANYFADTIEVSRESVDNTRNDSLVLYGNLDVVGDVDSFRFDPSAETRWVLDIDAAEFQMPVDAVLTVTDSSGAVIATNDDAIDGHSAIASVDPFIDLDLSAVDGLASGPLTVSVAGKNGSAGSYRLKVMPGRAIDSDAPRVIAVSPDNGDLLPTTNQILVFMDDMVDVTTLTPTNFRVVNSTGGSVSGSATFNPLDATIIWTADAGLPNDTYTLTMSGVTDLAGNTLDGDVGPGYAFPLTSGDGIEGGAFTSSFTVNQAVTTPARVTTVDYVRDPYSRGQFTMRFSNRMSLQSVLDSEIQMRHAGSDGVFDTADDVLSPLDPAYESISSTFSNRVTFYSRGIPDAGDVRLEGSLVDVSGLDVAISEVVAVPPVTDFIHGPMIVGTSFTAGEHIVASDPESGGLSSIDIRFSGAVDPATLTPDNLFLHRSADPIMFEGDDEILRDADGTIDYDPL
ncbi:MAG: FG-GAP-like repeat-containing protein, partial [Planctomycetota bacterium]